MTNNKLLCVALRLKAEEMGYTVTTNKSSIAGLDNSHASKYFKSRPDLVTYKENRVHIVMENEPSSDETSEESTDETTTTTTTTLQGAMTENGCSEQGAGKTYSYLTFQASRAALPSF